MLGIVFNIGIAKPMGSKSKNIGANLEKSLTVWYVFDKTPEVDDEVWAIKNSQKLRLLDDINIYMVSDK